LLGIKGGHRREFLKRIHRSNLVGMGVLPLTLQGRHGPQDARHQPAMKIIDINRFAGQSSRGWN